MKREDGSPVDVVLVHDVTDDGKGYRVLRQRDDRLEACAIKPLEEGKPVHGEIVKLRQRKESPLLYDVLVQVDTRTEPNGARASEGASTEDERSSWTRKGPVQVTSDRYRSGWESIWGPRRGERAPN